MEGDEGDYTCTLTIEDSVESNFELELTGKYIRSYVCTYVLYIHWEINTLVKRYITIHTLLIKIYIRKFLMKLIMLLKNFY